MTPEQLRKAAMTLQAIAVDLDGTARTIRAFVRQLRGEACELEQQKPQKSPNEEE